MNDTILTESTQTALWQRLVREAEGRVGRCLDEELESYLVFTLMRHQADASLGRRVMALELLESLGRAGRVREDSLRDVGDQCLLLVGLYPQHVERRLLPLSYFRDLGREAYGHLGQLTRAGLAALFRHLAEGFAELARVLFELRPAARRMAGLSPLARHDWCEQAGQVDPRVAAEAFPGAIVLPGPSALQ